MPRFLNLAVQVGAKYPGYELLTVLDCGYLNDPRARKRADKIFAAGVSKATNLSIELHPPRIYIVLPQSKKAAIIKRFKLSAKPVHWGSTHCFPVMHTEKRFEVDGRIGG
jgi:hypothetical protein